MILPARLGSREPNSGDPTPGLPRRPSIPWGTWWGGAVTTKRTGPGAPPKDDSEAVADVRRVRLLNPRLSYREAARRYFKKHPKKLGDTKLESAARRVADKARRADGRSPGRSHLQDLELLHLRLFGLVQDLAAIIARLQGKLPASENRDLRKRGHLL